MVLRDTYEFLRQAPREHSHEGRHMHYMTKYSEGKVSAKPRKGGGYVWQMTINEGLVSEVLDEDGKPVFVGGMPKTATKWHTMRRRIDVPCTKVGASFTNVKRAKTELKAWREQLVKTAEEEHEKAVREAEAVAARSRFSYDSMTVSSFLDSYFAELEGLGREQSTIYHYRKGTARLVRVLGSKKLGELTEEDLSEFVASCRADGLRGRSICGQLQVLKQGMKAHRKHISSDPFAYFKMPRRDESRPNPLTRESLDMLLKQLAESEPTPFMTAVELALRTGMRRGEVCGLRWRSVDLETGTITVENAISRADSGTLYVKGPKTERGRRVIQGNEPIRVMLNCRLSFMVAEYMRLHRCGEQDARDAVLAMYVCGSVDGSFAKPDTIGAWWKGFSSTLRGIEHTRPTFHNLRDSYASYAIAAGVDVVTVAKVLGHSDPSITLRIYAGVLKENEEKAQEIMADVFGMAA